MAGCSRVHCSVDAAALAAGRRDPEQVQVQGGSKGADQTLQPAQARSWAQQVSPGACTTDLQPAFMDWSAAELTAHKMRLLSCHLSACLLWDMHPSLALACCGCSQNGCLHSMACSQG